MNTRIGAQPDFVSYKGRKKYLTTELTDVLSFNPKNKNKVCANNVTPKFAKGHIIALSAVLLFVGGIIYSKITAPKRAVHQFEYILKEMDKMIEESKEQQLNTLPSDTVAMNKVI